MSLLSKKTDQELLGLLQQENEEAFDVLYERYVGQLYVLAYNKVRSREVARELVHDVLVKLWLKKHTIIVDTSLAPYLFTLLRNATLQYIRAQSNRTDYINQIVPFEAEKHSYPTGYTPASVILAQELQAAINQQVNQLPEKCREIFVLSRYEEYSVEEIAQKLNLSRQTVKNQLTKATRLLRHQLKDYAVILLIANLL